MSSTQHSNPHHSNPNHRPPPGDKRALYNSKVGETPGTYVVDEEQYNLLKLMQSAEATGRVAVKVPSGEIRGWVFIVDSAKVNMCVNCSIERIEADERIEES